MIDQAAKRALCRRTDATGFALIELMIALTIALLLIAGMITVLQNVRTTYNEQQGLAQLQDNARLGMTLMTDVIESAGYFPNPAAYSAASTMPASPSFTTPGTPVIAGGTTAAGDTVTVRYAPDNTQDLYNCMGGTNSFLPYDTWENTFTVVSTGASTAALECTFWSKQYGANGPIPLVTGLTNGTGAWPKGMTLKYGVTTQTDTAGTCLDTYKTEAQMGAADWAHVCSVKVTLNFINPVAPPGTANGAANSYIPFTIVIPIMISAGGAL
jgi:type IV pilus assembly protein PilW